MHDGDRERAASLACNLMMPDKETLTKNPYLNKVPEFEPNNNLHTLDLMTMAQITPEQYKKTKNMYEEDIYQEE
jgi:hypothetical protein